MSERIPGLKRSLFRCIVTDPLEGLGVGFVLLIFAILPLRWAEGLGATFGAIAGMVAWRRNRIGLLI